jgi:hypothetical protein
MVNIRSSESHIYSDDQETPSFLCNPKFFIIIVVIGVRLSPLGTAATTGLLYQPQKIDDGDCGTIGGINIGRGS